jgi:hypothetical protein
MKKILTILIVLLTIVFCSGCSKSELVTTDTLPEIFEPTVIERTIPATESSTVEITTTEEIPTTEEEMTTEEETTPVEEATTEVETEPETTKPAYTFYDIEPHIMYATGSVNIRTLPSTEGDIVDVAHVNDEMNVVGKCNETGWYVINYKEQTLYMSDRYLSEQKYVPPTTSAAAPTTAKPSTTITQTPAAGFTYLSICGVCPNRDYELYLYNQLSNLGLSWWYPYAVAQIFQESRWNPNSTNGRDHGICQFKGIYFADRAKHFAGMDNADIWNPYDSLKVYAYYIKAILAATNNQVDAALSFYIRGDSYGWDQTYIDHVMNWYYCLTVEE